MRATDIIRGVLDIIDQVEERQTLNPVIAVTVGVPKEETIRTGVDTNRFKHVYAMLDAERNNPAMYDNSPNETISGIDSVTQDAGGGWNGPKNPADMRADSISMYPNHQHKAE